MKGIQREKDIALGDRAEKGENCRQTTTGGPTTQRQRRPKNFLATCQRGGEVGGAHPNSNKDTINEAVLTGQECVNYVTLAVTDIFGELKAESQSDLQKESMGNVAHRPTISQGEWSRALQHTDIHTATGLDDIPARLLKKMGRKSRERL